MKTPYLDVNAWLGAWPFQYFRDDTAAKLEERLVSEGFARALVGTPEAAFNHDCLAANRLLVKRLAGRPHCGPSSPSIPRRRTGRTPSRWPGTRGRPRCASSPPTTSTNWECPPASPP